ncbi:hypothetical protein CSC36_6587 [Pseudomonas aeruginosa]|nr:hypothetical protein CSC36_6587 [Pseudomonas aeruginosa]
MTAALRRGDRVVVDDDLALCTVGLVDVLDDKLARRERGRAGLLLVISRRPLSSSNSGRSATL